MRIAIIVVIAIAAIFAGGAFFILSNYLEEREKRIYAEAEEAKPGVAAVEVVVADIDLPAGTAITSSQLKWQPWPDDSLDGDYIAYREEDEDADKSDLEDQLLDMVVRRAIMKGEPVTLPKLFAREDAVFMAGMLSPGMRAVAIKVKDVTGVGGFVMPGDHVDVIVTVKWKIDPEARKGGLPYTEFTSETIVQNARVMAVDQAFGDFEENAVKADTVTLEVTPKQAEVIAVATGIGDLSLSLRSLLPGGAGAFSGFTSDRESLYAMGGSFPTTDRLAQPVAVAATDGATDGKRFRTVTAVRDIPPGTLLRATDVEWTELSPDVPPEDYLVQGREQIGMSQLAGALLTAGVKAGEPLPIASLLVSGQPEFLASALRPGMRAASVAVAPGAFIGMPGDEVDVVLVASVDDRRFNETILQKARILSISLRGNMAAIEVTPKQYEAVAVAQSMGEVSLSLRSRNTMLADFYGGQFTSDLEVSRAMSGGAEALAARAGVGIAIEPTIVTEAAPMALVVAAGRELRVGDLLRESDFQWVELPADVTEGRYFAQGRDALEQLRGALVKESVAAGAPIEVNMVMRASEPGFLAAAIMPGLRAADIPLPDSSNIGGFVVPGDLVDVVLTATVGERRFSETILQEVRVLAYNAQRNTATVEVSAKQSETLAVAQTMGPLQLSLRSDNTMLADVYGGRFTSDL